MWFERLTGFREESPAQVRQNLSVENGILHSHVNGKKYVCGWLETPSLEELRKRVLASECSSRGQISLQEVVADVQQLHTEQINAGALFQVASQFNLLEMISPYVTPEDGVDGYEYDRTQGPVCAIAAGAGTIYRNYFANINGEIGQTADNQIDCLVDIGKSLGNIDHQLWKMTNGYALATDQGLKLINQKIASYTESEIDDLRKLLRIGVQSNTEVTLNEEKQTVSQAYCSALPVAYTRLPATLWERFARVVLEASYEATICSGILNARNTGNNKVYLTLVGGGVFGNKIEWIIDAIERALKLYQNEDLDVFIVSYGQSTEQVQELINRY